MNYAPTLDKKIVVEYIQYTLYTHAYDVISMARINSNEYLINV